MKSQDGRVNIENGNHKWCPEGTRVVKAVWREGTVGGVSDSTITEVLFPRKQTKDELALYAQNERVRSGSCFDSEKSQLKPTSEAKVDGGWKYTWRYCNSTE